MRRLMGILVCLAATSLWVVSPATAAPRGVLVGHASAGLADQMTARQLSRAHAIALPAPPLFSANPLAHTTYGGSQPAFPIYSEGYVRRKDYYRTVGRLYARVSATITGACTATVVARRIIVTAAHCLVSPRTGKVYSAFLFVPAQYGRKSPEGRWAGQTAYIWKAWVNEPYESLDYGFLTIRPNQGRNIGGVTGWEGILANSNVKKIRSFGYPGGGMFASRCGLTSCYQWECYSPLGRRVRDPTGLYEVGMGCHGEEGSSGGPWFERFHGHRYLASNVSTGVRRQGARHDINEWGPYYDGHTLKLLADAKAGA
jgi:V8-like Glu-specific endopeptidase